MKKIYEAHDPRGIRGTMNPEMEKPNSKILKKILNHLPRGTEGDKWYSFTGTSDLSKLRVFSFRPNDLKHSKNPAAKELVKTINIYIGIHNYTYGDGSNQSATLQNALKNNELCIMVYAEDTWFDKYGWSQAGDKFVIYSGETGDVIMSDYDIKGLRSKRTGRIDKRPRARDAMTPDIANRLR